MKRNNDGGLDLTNTEVRALAFRAVARDHVIDFEDHLQWEDYPEVSESSWHRMMDEVADISNGLVTKARYHALVALVEAATEPQPIPPPETGQP